MPEGITHKSHWIFGWRLSYEEALWFQVLWVAALATTFKGWKN